MIGHLTAYASHFAGHSILNVKSSVGIHSYELSKMLLCQEDNFTHPVLTFGTSEGLRVEINFDKFNLNEFQDYLLIGDGFSRSGETTLARFNGNILPHNVTSVSTSAWLTLQSSLVSKGSDLQMTATAINFTGI